MMSLIFTMLSHRNNSLQVDMSHHLDIILIPIQLSFMKYSKSKRAISRNGPIKLLLQYVNFHRVISNHANCLGIHGILNQKLHV